MRDYHVTQQVSEQSEHQDRLEDSAAMSNIQPATELAQGIFASEPTARRYVLSHCEQDGKLRCPKCDEARVYRLSDERLRCSRCRYTFHELSRRWINVGGLSCLDWLRLLKLFEQELTANRMAPQLGLSYNTVYKAVTTLRFSLLSQALDAKQLLTGAFGLDLGFENGRIGMEKSKERMGSFPVFGLMEKSGWAFVDLLPYMTAETVLHFHFNFKLKLERMGNIVYSDKYKHYDALIFCGDETIPLHIINGRDRQAYVDSLVSGFWRFAQDRLRQYNGVTSRRFPLYLKELEFRYNHRNEELFPLLVSSLCRLVPEYE
ncbi:transposase [Desulfocurvibacter africanus subsp. africanus str. Walvis Bay]|uniref:Transposase n=2 Tax=Desulfocurvibacter africanus TaxID=873 RepID=F3Z293_DESAF|nr:transposase [Desulfocurvibacter africanus]EGJ50133.1 transposase [Desulfocurvibacter africanus subsp. africanus str. Walvis Bay]